MKLPRVRYRPWVQTQLWQDSLRVHGRFGAATVVGDFFEEASAQLLGIQRLMTDSSADLCPDHEGDQFFIECKACRQDRGVYLLHNLELIVYHRWLRTRPVPTKLFYTLWNYNVAGPAKFKWREELWDALAANVSWCVIVDFSTMRQLFRQRKQECGDWNRYAGHRFKRIRREQFAGFEHWRCWMLRERVQLKRPIFTQRLWSGRVYDRDVKDVPMYMLVEGDG